MAYGAQYREQYGSYMVACAWRVYGVWRTVHSAWRLVHALVPPPLLCTHLWHEPLGARHMESDLGLGGHLVDVLPARAGRCAEPKLEAVHRDLGHGQRAVVVVCSTPAAFQVGAVAVGLAVMVAVALGGGGGDRERGFSSSTRGMPWS